LDSLIKEAISWFDKQRDHYFPSSSPLGDIQKKELQPFFSAEILDRARILDLSQTQETLPYPPFYETVRAGGNRVLPDAAHITGIPFVDLIAFNRTPTLRTLFHNLVHVTQFVLVGTERVVRGYFKTLNEVRLWMVVPFEEQAYQLDARYTRNPLDVFSVEDEVREWMRTGHY
jgi:hypothetical protein